MLPVSAGSAAIRPAHHLRAGCARRAIQREFLAWKRSLSAAVLLVTHDLSEAFRLASRIAVLHRGRILQVGTPDDLRRRPADAFVREFVQEFVEPVETAT